MSERVSRRAMPHVASAVFRQAGRQAAADGVIVAAMPGSARRHEALAVAAAIA
ncbi:hypothetical protein AB0L59_38930 [Streptomyces sp. NPDC052109]|uniref:hypothetical protein n=1 Tax=Streptomyces sp. NPDC052109 TaxID=3155527 RepID=UPI00343AE12A